MNMIQAKKNIEDGQDVNVNVVSTLSSVIDEIEKEESIKTGIIDFDYDKESKKQELKELRNQGISDILDEFDER